MGGGAEPVAEAGEKALQSSVYDKLGDRWENSLCWALTTPQFFLSDIGWRPSSVAQLQIAYIQNLKHVKERRCLSPVCVQLLL